jgi:hypothetical protein
MQKKKVVSKEVPLAEITLRKYEKPYDLSGRDLIKKICLSVGLLQPGDSRDVIIDVLHVLLRERKELNSDQIVNLVIENRKSHKVPLAGIAPSNVRRQLKRLRDIFIIEKVANNYRVNENAKLADIFEEKIEKFYLRTIVERVKEYLSVIDNKK